MIAPRNSDDYMPLTWWGKVPIYAATILVMVHCATMVLFALLAPTRLGWLASACVYISPEVIQEGQIWRAFTYAFVHDIAQEKLMFLLDMAMLFWFGQEVEKYLGRRNFLILYGTLLLAAPAFLTVLGLFGVPTGVLEGSSALHFAIFVSFVAIYPTAEIFFGIQARWIAAVFLAINSLILISSAQWTGLSVLWQGCGTALLVLRIMGVYSLQGWPSMEKAVETIVQRTKPTPKKTAKKPADVDAILDKITRQGISSLNAEERLTLEQEREALLQKERRE